MGSCLLEAGKEEEASRQALGAGAHRGGNNPSQKSQSKSREGWV